MTEPWVGEAVLIAAADRNIDRITVDSGRQVCIDGRVATTQELRMLAHWLEQGYLELNTLDPPDGARCCWTTPAGTDKATWWSHLVGAARPASTKPSSSFF